MILSALRCIPLVVLYTLQYYTLPPVISIYLYCSYLKLAVHVAPLFHNIMSVSKHF